MKPTTPNSRNRTDYPFRHRQLRLYSQRLVLWGAWPAGMGSVTSHVTSGVPSAGFACHPTLAKLRSLIRVGPNTDGLSRKRRRHRTRQWRALTQKPHKWIRVGVATDPLTGLQTMQTEYEAHDGKLGYRCELMFGSCSGPSLALTTQESVDTKPATGYDGSELETKTKSKGKVC